MFTDNIKDMGTNEDKYNVTILIAEDEESNFLLLKTILKRHCNVLQARTGLELLKVFAEKGADMILLDIKMPEMNGIEALKEIRKKDTNIPIIMQSAYAFENDMEAGPCCRKQRIYHQAHQYRRTEENDFQILAADNLVRG